MNSDRDQVVTLKLMIFSETYIPCFKKYMFVCISIFISIYCIAYELISQVVVSQVIDCFGHQGLDFTGIMITLKNRTL